MAEDLIIKEFKKDEHYDIVKQWWELSKKIPQPVDKLPRYGVIIFDGDEPLAAGWIIRTDISECFVEDFIANKNAKSKNRSKAIDLTIKGLEALAKMLGYTGVVGLPTVKRLINRAEKLGYTIVSDSQVMVAKEI